MVSTISRRERIHQTTLNCNITPNISSILQRLFHGGRMEAARQHGHRTQVWDWRLFLVMERTKCCWVWTKLLEPFYIPWKGSNRNMKHTYVMYNCGSRTYRSHFVWLVWGRGLLFISLRSNVVLVCSPTSFPMQHASSIDDWRCTVCIHSWKLLILLKT